MCCPPVNQHSGTAIQDLIESVYGAPVPRKSSVDGPDPWRILIEAQSHLCGQSFHEPIQSRYKHMERGDVQAWNLMAKLQDELLCG